MNDSENGYLRHQHQRWLRPDAINWIRPDAARFLKPGTDPADVFPALAMKRQREEGAEWRRIAADILEARAQVELFRRQLDGIKQEIARRRAAATASFKYSPSQPRIPAGRTGGGRWTGRGSGGGSGGGGIFGGLGGGDGEGGDAGSDLSAYAPMGDIDFGDLTGLGDFDGLFSITPNGVDFDGLQLAGDPPTGDSNEPPEPPKIPQQVPATRDERMGFVRAAAEWVRIVGRLSPLVGSYFEALDQVDSINRLTGAIKSANDPPMALDELQDRVLTSTGTGYEKHHLAEQAAARDAKNPESLIQARKNLVLVPTLKHIEISKYDATKVELPDGTWLSPREQLIGKDFETRRQYGLKILRDYGVMK